LATLELQMELIGHGYSLKDATAYNIQFVSGKPIFIDLPSIERADRLDIWPALGQFNRMFTLPLLLHQRKGMSLRSCFLAHLDGMDVDEARRGFGLLELIRPDLLLDLTLPYLLGRRTKNKDYWRTADKTRIARSRRHFVSGRIENGKWRIETAASPGRRPAKESPGRDAQARTGETPVPHTLDAQRLNLQRLHRKLRKLASRYRPAGTWADYTRTCSYNDRADASKQSLVNAFFAEYPPSSVLDVGCNTGTYSKLAAEAGARVLAIDSDPASVDLLFRDVGEQQNPILPLCVDLANPSPGIGFRNRERSPFLERCRSECVLALAVIHHLHVSANLPLTEIRDLFADIAEEYLVLEFVPRDDVMFQQLIRFRADLYDGFTLENCITCFSEQFELIRQAVIADSPRTLLFWRKRGY
jgi:SAM-dependent methyltransferase